MKQEKFASTFFVSAAKKINKEIKILGKNIKTFEENLTNKESNEDYLKCKRILNYIFDQKRDSKDRQM